MQQILRFTNLIVLIAASLAGLTALYSCSLIYNGAFKTVAVQGPVAFDTDDPSVIEALRRQKINRLPIFLSRGGMLRFQALLNSDASLGWRSVLDSATKEDDLVSISFHDVVYGDELLTYPNGSALVRNQAFINADDGKVASYCSVFGIKQCAKILAYARDHSPEVTH